MIFLLLLQWCIVNEIAHSLPLIICPPPLPPHAIFFLGGGGILKMAGFIDLLAVLTFVSKTALHHIMSCSYVYVVV